MPYDKEDSQSVYKAGANVNTMTYDGDGLKRAEIASTSRTTLVWDGADTLQARS